MATIIDSHFGESALQVEVSAGLSIEGIVRQCEIPEAIWTNVVIVLNGIEVAREQWDSVYPVQSDVISVHVVPLGGGDGKNILRLVATIAVAIAAPGIGSALAGKLGITSSFGIAAVQAGVAIVGSLAINALIPPPKIRPNVPGGSATSNAYFLSGQSNRARPYEIVPITYGTHKLFANLASAPHIFSAGTSSVFEAVYDFGLGAYSINDVKVGDTPLSLFKNQRRFNHILKPDPYSASPNSAFEPIDLQIYDFPVKSVDLSIGLNEVGDEGTATTHPECHTAVVELTFPQGLTRFDDQGANQSNNVKYRIGYRAAGETDFGPLPNQTNGYAGDDHLSFTGIGIGDDSGPTDENGNPIYDPFVYFRSTKVNANGKVIVQVYFFNGNKGYYGAGFEQGNPERPKESFYWENVDTGEVYQQKNTYNGLDTDPPWNKTKWAYNQEPAGIPLYTDANDLGDYAAAGTLVYNNPPINETLYAFEFIAPDEPGRWKLKTDLYEWWGQPYGTGGDRCAETQGTFKYAQFQNVSGEPVQGVDEAILTVEATVDIPSDQEYELDNPQSRTYMATFMESFEGIDGPWEPIPETNAIVYYDGSYYVYNSAQRQYVIDNIKGDFVKIDNAQRDNSQFYRWTATEYSAIITAGMVRLVNEGVLTVFNISDTRFLNPQFPDGGYSPNPLPEQDDRGSLFTVYGTEATAGKISIVIPMPQAGQYDIKVERIDDLKTRLSSQDDETDLNRFIDSSSWTRIGSRGFPSDRAVFDLQHRHSLMEVTFEASEAIQGNVQELNAILTARIRRLDSNLQWLTPNSTTDSDNPAWVVLDILTGWSIQNRRAPRWHTDHCGWLRPEQLDLSSFYSFAQHCNQSVSYQTPTGTATRKRYTTNMVMASDAPIIETCQNILGQCRAQLIITQAGKIGVMLDEARTTPRQLFTPSNSWEFSGSRSFTEIPHAFNVQFTSPELGWQQATVVVYRPGYDATGSGANDVATLFEDLDTVGITNPHQAQLYGAYMLAQAIIRNEIFTLNVDTENLVCQRGDLVQVAHDAPLMGGRSCVITGEQDGWLHVSERFGFLDSGNNRYTLRTDDGQIISGSVTDIDDDRIKISNQYQAEVGNLIVIGAQNLVTEDYLIQSIRPKPDMTAELSLVKYDARVYQVDDGIYPVWSPNFSQNDLSGGTHSVVSLTGTSTLIYKDRQPYTKAVLNWGVSPDNDSLAGFYIEWQRQGASNRESLGYVASGTRTFTHEYSSRSSTYGTGTYYVVPYSSLGYRGREGSVLLSKKVDTTPPTVRNFTATLTEAGNTQLTWDCDDIDLQGFTIRYKAAATLPLGQGEVVGVPSYDKRSWLLEGAKEGMYWITATDTSGNTSDAQATGNYTELLYPTPGPVQNFRLWIEQGLGVLKWDLLDDPTITLYQLRWDANEDLMNGDLASEYGSTDANTNAYPSEKLEGSFFIRAKNIYGKYGPWTRTTSTFEGLAIFNENLTQELRFVNRFPFSDVTIKWSVSGDQSLINRYRVYFYPTDPDVTTRDTETAAERPPVLVYEGQERQCLTTVATTEDTGRQHGVFIIQVISIYGTPGEEARIDFAVLRDTTPPAPPEGFFVNIVGNTNADIAWIASQSIDIDRYELRYTPNVDSPRWEAAEHLATVGYDVTGYQTNARTGSYLLQAIDTSGNKSEVLIQRTTVAELPDLNVIEVLDEAPDWLGKKIYFDTEGGRLIMKDAPYTGGDEFGAEPYRESYYYYAEQVDLGDIYETRITAKLEAYGQLGNTFMVDWNPLSSVDPIAGVEENEDWDCWIEYRAGTNADVIADWPTMAEIDPIAGDVADDWTPWRRFLAADVTARFLQFRIIARGYHPEAEVSVIQGRVEVDMPDRYWTKADVPIEAGGTTLTIDPPFRHIEAISVTVDGNDYNVRAVVSDKDPASFKVTLIDQPSGDSVAGQVDVFVSGYGIQRSAII